MRLGSARVLAWVVDWLTILFWVGVVAAVGVPLYRTGVIDRVGIVLTVFAYVLPVLYVVMLFIGAGRTPYDRLAGTRVASRATLPAR